MRIKKMGVAGDTIVEVMLALSVLGAVIVGGYSIATRSLNGVRVSQERSEALKIAEAQIEAVRQEISSITNVQSLFVHTSGPLTGVPLSAGDIKWYGKAPGSPLPAGNEFGFCVSPAGESVRIDLIDAEKINVGVPPYPSECNQQGLYYVYINTTIANVPSGGSLTYRVYVTWERAGGGGVETLNLQNRFMIVNG